MPASQVENPRPSPGRAHTAALLAAWAVGTVGMMIVVLVDVFDATRAVPPEEFPAADVLFSMRPDARLAHVVGTVLVGVLVGLDLNRRLHPARAAARRTAALVGLGLTAAGMIASFAHGLFALVAAVGLYLVALSDTTRTLDQDDPTLTTRATEAVEHLGQVRWRTVASRAVETLGLPALAFTVTVALELHQYTARFAGRFFTQAAYEDFVKLALASAAVAGVRLGIELALVLLIAVELARADETRSVWWSRVRLALLTAALWLLTSSSGLTSRGLLVGLVWIAVVEGVQLWASRRPTGARLVVLPLVAGMYLWARTSDLFLAALADEVAALGLTWMVHLLFGLLGLVFASWTASGLLAALRRFEVADRRELIALTVLAFFCPPLALLAGRLGARSLRSLMRRAAPLALLWLVGLLVLLLELNYPSFTDFSEFLQRLYSLLIGYAVCGVLLVVWLCVVGPGAVTRVARSLPARIAIVAALGLAVWTFARLDARQTLRMIGDQYSKIALRTVHLARVLPEPVRIPLGPDDDPGPAPRLARQARLPDDAASRIEPGRRPPIVVIVWDAARVDHLDLYGYPRQTAPGAARLAEDAVVFERAVASATGTTASLRHLFSGRHSSRYMLATDHHPFVTGALCEAGYDAFVLNILGSDFNGVSARAFWRNQPLSAPELEFCEANTIEFGTYEEQAKTDAALEILDRLLAERQGRAHPGDGIFMFLHATATHWPWKQWDDSPDFGDALVDRYDESMFHADLATARFLDGLRERGLYDDAIIVLTADHGTGLDDHGRYGGFEPYEEQLRVPLVIKAPGFEPRRVDTPVSGIDLAPTLVSLVSPGADNPYDGFALSGLMSGRIDSLPRRYLFALSAFEDALALYDLEAGHKLHVHRTDRYEMLYDLRADPDELVNLADDRPDVVARYMELLRRFLWHDRTGVGNPFHYRELEVD